MRNVYLILLLWAFWGEATAQQTTLVAAETSMASSDARNGAGNTTTAPQAAPEATPATAAPAVYNTAEEMPAFPGGTAAFAQFMRRTLQYPDAALAANISGKVHVRFTVAEDGRLLDPEVVKGLGYGLDQEALRLVRLMPWWTPGKVAGIPVRVRYVLPLVFRAL